MNNQIVMENLATDIYKWCVEHELWGDNIIYFNGKAWSNQSKWNGIEGVKLSDNLYEYTDKNPKDYFEYVNPDTLSMSFEGTLNYVLNAYVDGWAELEAEFGKLFEKCGYYYEMGNAWNLSVYE